MEKVCCPRCNWTGVVVQECYFCHNCHWPMIVREFVQADGSTGPLQIGDYNWEMNEYWAGAQWVGRETLLALGVLPPWKQRVMLVSDG